MSAIPAGAQSIVRALRQAEASYPGGDLTRRLPLARRHAEMVGQWIALLSRAAAGQAAVPPTVTSLPRAVEIVDSAHLRAARAPVLIRDGAGAVALPHNRVLIAGDYPLFTVSGLARYARGQSNHPLNPLVAWRWALTDLLLRLNASNAPVDLSVVDYGGAVVLSPYAHGFAIGTSALYTRAYNYAQPAVNIGFDDVSVKVLATGLSALSGLSYVADVSTMAPYGRYLTTLRALLAADGVAATAWQGLYQSSNVLDAVFALIRATHRTFGQDPNPTHIGANVDRNAYGYGIMKAISERDSAALTRILRDFSLPSVPAVPSLTVSAA